MLKSMKRVFFRNKIKEDIKQSGAESVEVVKPQEVAGGVTMFGSAHTEVLGAAREVRLRKTAGNSAKLSETASFSSEHTKVMKATRKDKLDTAENKSERVLSRARTFHDLAEKFAERESALPLFDRFKGWFSKSKKQSDTEEYNEGSVSDESSLDHETASKRWYQKGVFGSSVNWLRSIVRRDGYDAMSECDTESTTSEIKELVQEDDKFTNSMLGFFDISLRSESADEMTIESHLNSVNLESGDTHSLTPEPSEKGKIGLVQRITNMIKTIRDFLMSPFRASEVDHNDNSYKNFMTSLDETKFVIVGGTAVNNGGPEGNPLISDAPPSYEEVIKSDAETTPKTSGLHPNNTCKNWREDVGTRKAREERAAARTYSTDL